MKRKLDLKKTGRRLVKEVTKGILAFLCCMAGMRGYYPLVPAYFAVQSLKGYASLGVLGGMAVGMYACMTVNVMIRYIFVLMVIGVGIRLYLWANRTCSSIVGGLIAGSAAVAMNYAGTAVWVENQTVLWMGAFEGIMVFGLTVCIHYILGFPLKLGYLLSMERGKSKQGKALAFANGPRTEKMESFAYAVNGLSDAFMAMSRPKETPEMEEVSLLEQELTGRLCASCDGCVVCWNENRMRRQGGIRALLHAVVNHTTKEELIELPYVEGCKQYEDMVEEAIRAFGRLELNQAWYNRLLENRYVIAQQLDAMANLVENWAKTRVLCDHKYKNMMAAIIYEAKENGLHVEHLHIYEENKKFCIEAEVSSKWNGGIPVKHYVKAVEKAVRKPLRTGKDTKGLLTQESVLVVLYEDTGFYVLQGIASEKKNGSSVTGDSFSFFSLDDGNYHICISDGMGSGSHASQESEMVVDLLQKFIEAGFRKETAVKLMNSAMVLQGEDNSFSTLDYSVIDLYTGNLELIKIGGAATFIKRKSEVECIDKATLPAGADVRLEVESTKRTLQNGDFLVMVTDGVIEYLHVRNPKETLCDMINDIQTDNAGVMAEEILQKVLLYTGGYAMDDMTILVTGIWEK
uniref:SpoIIE family protein phosphatase n=1 Tax=Agathobacter sp. TaxID=2021311 RepID=UPI0040572572